MIYPNTLPYNLSNIHDPQMRETLQFMKENRLNPIPLDRQTQKPLTDINYLYENPIKKEDARLFLKECDIGLVPRYNNVVFVNSTIVDVPLGFGTTSIKNGFQAGYSYIFYIDKPFYKTIGVDEFTIEVINNDFIVIPPSRPHQWSSMCPPSFIKAEDLEEQIKDLAELLQKI